MSFRQFGGMNYAAKHNIVGSNYNTSNNLLVTQNVGQPNSYINFLSDISGNINFYGDLDLSGNLNISGDLDLSGNLNISGDLDLSGNLNIGGDVDLSGNLNVSGDIDCSGNITAQYMFLSSYPPNINPSQNSVVPKGYVDSIASGIKPLPASVTVSFSPITLSGTGQTVSGVTLSSYVGSYILVNGQNNSTPDVTNGVYIISSGTWLRSTYLEPGGTYIEAQGTLTTILQGDYKNHRYICVSNPSTVGLDPLLWSEFDIPYSIGQGLETVFINNETILQVDPSLNFLTLVDASSSNPNLDIGTENALTIKMGKSNGSTTTTINGNVTFISTNPPTSSAVQPVSSDSSTKVPTTAWVQSAITGVTPITFTTTASTTGYNSGSNYTYWYFATYPSWSAFSWFFSTPTTSRTNVNKTGLGSSPPLNVGTIGANGSFILMTGTGIKQPYFAQSSNMITFCGGFQQNYSISASANAAVLSVINCIGATPGSAFFQSNQLTENNVPCPPTANGLSGYIVLQALNGDYTGLGTPTLKFTQFIA
jgi:hypothetical protein